MPDDDQTTTGSQQDGVTPDPSAPAPDTQAGPAAKAGATPDPSAPVKKTARKTTRRPAKRAATPEPTDPVADPALDAVATAGAGDDATAEAPAPRKKAAPRKRAAARRPAGAPATTGATTETTTAATTDVAVDAPANAPAAPEAADAAGTAESGDAPAAPAVLFQAPVKKSTPRKRAARKATPAPEEPAEAASEAPSESASEAPGEAAAESPSEDAPKKAKSGGKKKSSKKKKAGPDEQAAAEDEAASPVATDDPGSAAPLDTEDAEPVETDDAAASEDPADTDDADDSEDSEDSEDSDDSAPRRRRRRGGRRRRRPADGSDGPDGSDGSDRSDSSDAPTQGDAAAADGAAGDDEQDTDDAGESGEGGSGGSRRRRRRRRSGDPDSGDTQDNSGGGNGGGNGGGQGGGQGGGRSRRPRNAEDEITSVQGSTRLEAKKQRRREGREAGRRRAPIVSEAEFLARREAVDRVMVVRQRQDLTQIAVLEDKVLVEHYVARESQTSMIGNVYIGRVQNVLPSMEAAFVDIGKGRNAVIYAGEVNWQALGHQEGQPRKIESVLSSGQPILVQVSKDPVGHKGARLTGQISLPGRFLVYVPEGTTSGISRKLPDTERHRLKTLLKQIVPDGAGVIVRTAAEGASEEELTLDVERLTARWSDIEEKIKNGKSPQLLYGEPDLTLKVVRDLFTEDFGKLVVQGDDAWDLVDGYVSHVAPELRERLEHYGPAEEGSSGGADVFAAYRIDEQIAKGLDRKVWLPSGGSLVIDRTEAMTVVDVNTGKFTGSGGNLEETVTKNNLEAAEEMVRQLRLRDIGGIIVIDFIDMVLESNRDLVLRRLVECLGRDRTRHQVAEVTSLGLVQMTRKRIGTGLVEAFSQDCEACKGRGIVLADHPVDHRSRDDDDGRSGGRRGRGGRRGGRGDDQSDGNGGSNGGNGSSVAPTGPPSPKDLAHSRPPEPREAAETPVETPAASPAEPDTGNPTPVDATAEQVVVGRPAGTAPEPQVVPSTDGPAESPEETPQAPEVPEAPAAPVEPEAPEAVDQPRADPAPRIVTSTRRRSARRAAGPPAVVPAHAGTQAEPSTPDVTSGESLATTVEEAEAPEGDEGESSLLHVPVKRKGARKR